MSARDFAMARLSAALIKADELRDSATGVLSAFAWPDDDDKIKDRLEILDDMMSSCHELLVSLQLAHEATSNMEPDEVGMSEEDLQPDDRDEG